MIQEVLSIENVAFKKYNVPTVGILFVRAAELCSKRDIFSTHSACNIRDFMLLTLWDFKKLKGIHEFVIVLERVVATIEHLQRESY